MLTLLSLRIPSCRCLLFDRSDPNAELTNAQSGRWFCVGGMQPGFIDMDKQLALASLYAVPKSLRAGISALDPLLYIYTSGTTGLPKAAIINHLRYWMGASVFTSMH